MKRDLAFLLASFLLISSALAGSPPESCNSAATGCSLESDILVFAEGDVLNEIVARIIGCDDCIANDDGTFTLMGDAVIDWGPYDPGLGSVCATVNATTHLFLNYEKFVEGAGGAGPAGDEKTYRPAVLTTVFHPNVPTPLMPACVEADHLAYSIPWIELTGADGAESGLIATGDSAWLDLPESVRAEEGGTLLSRLQLEQFGFTQELGLHAERTDTPSSTLRFWPDSLPFKLGPYRTIFTEAMVRITTDASSGPPPYTPFPPRAGNLTTSPGGQVLTCDPNKPDWVTDPCNVASISNGSYFDNTDWSPVGSSIFDKDGMDVVLALPLGSYVTYETMFPRGVWARMDGPASITIYDSAIDSGSFDHATGWLRIQDGDLCAKPDRDRMFQLINDPGVPQIGANGSLMVAVEDLTSMGPLDWAVHEVDSLGCGTLYIPPLLDDRYPQVTWNESAVPTVLDRGIYAGFNYNRNKVCHDSMGAPLDKTCAAAGDCDTGSGEYCADGGFSPLCDTPGLGYDPQWRTEIDEEAKTFPINPGDPAQGDREMAFVARRSGVIGVFDGGDDPFTISNGNALEIGFDTYGLAFLESRSQGQDTIVQGEVVFDWPAATSVPFEEMKVCNCGYLDSGDAPELLVENNLMYWNATFFPYGLEFTANLNTDGSCPDASGSGCSAASAPADAVCITALTPIPRIEPDPTTRFPIESNGQPQKFVPLSGPRVEFDRDKEEPDLAAPYSYDLESFILNAWPSAHLRPLVESGVYPYGHYSLTGDLSMPYFGLTPSGIQVLTEDVAGVFHNPVNLFEEGNISNSYVTASRVIAADSVPVAYKVDYFTPSATSQDDGSDLAFRGRGALFAFADELDQDLGAVHVAGGMIMNPEGIVHNAADLGPAAALRLWGATDPGHRDQLNNIIPVQYLTTAYSNMYNDALAELVSENIYEPHTLPAPIDLQEDLYATGAIDYLLGHDHASISFKVDPTENPTMNGEKVTGYMLFSSPDPDQVEFFSVTSNQNTGGDFYSMDASLLEVDRHVKQGKMPITTQSREDQPGASQNMDMPGEQNIAFPGGGGAKAGGSFFPGLTWDYDYTMPGFVFNSLTGSLDLTDGGLSGVGFDELSATLKFWADGDWYFDAGVKLNYNGYGVKGGVLLGNTVDMTPLRNRDPDVADFLYGVTQFDGAYLGLGLKANLFDYGCLFRVNLGAEVAGWYISQSFGGKVRGFITGEGACVVSVRGDMTLMGGQVNDAYRIGGHFWVAGGVGFCSPGDWDTPADVMDDDFCAACVFDCKAYGTWPPEDMEIKLIGPDVDCGI